VAMIHSLDSIKLAEEIQKQAIKHNRIIPCLIQLHIAQEESKSGLHPDELDTFLKDPIWSSLNRVQISGVMSMATLTDDQDLIRSEFRKTREIFETLKKLYFKDNPHFKQISMGMSSDYQIAAEEGSSMVRIGSLVFGG
jgi:pyridoxal phosphate enzyme (YggS family)